MTADLGSRRCSRCCSHYGSRCCSLYGSHRRRAVEAQTRLASAVAAFGFADFYPRRGSKS